MNIGGSPNHPIYIKTLIRKSANLQDVDHGASQPLESPGSESLNSKIEIIPMSPTSMKKVQLVSISLQPNTDLIKHPFRL